MSFGEALKTIRENRGLNQSEFAKLLKTTRQTINRYEKSVREPNIRTAAIYAEILGVSLEALTGEKEKAVTQSESGLSENHRYLIQAIQNMSDENARKLRVIVDQVIDERGQ